MTWRFPLLVLTATLTWSSCNLSDPIRVRPGGDGGPTDEDTSIPDGGGDDSGGPDGAVDAGGDDMAPGDVGVDVAVDTGPPPLTFQDYCTGVAVEYVAWLRECYGNVYYDPEDPEIVDNFAQGCLDAAPGIDAGMFAFDEERARECLTALEEETCDYLTFFSDIEACQAVVTGQQQIGDDCYISTGQHFAIGDACGEGFCYNDACPGTCREFSAAGEACGGFPSIQCDPSAGITCDWQNERCIVGAAEGEDCSQTACADGLRCVDENGAATCVAPVPLGGACDVNDDLCEQSTFCSDGTCTSKAVTGASCRYNYHCPLGDSCLDQDGVGANSAPGICRNRAGAGSVCYETPDCLPDHRCVDNACEALPGAMEPCAGNRCSEGLWCRHEAMGDTGVCVPVGAEGDSCEHGYDSAPPFTGCEGNDLFCLDGVCSPPGGEGESCHPSYSQTCQEGLFCNRTDQTCTAFGAVGEPCNPWWYPSSCQEGLGCSCDPVDATCGVYEPAMNPGDTCQPERALGEPCQLSSQCESRSCWDPEQTGTRTCQPGACRLEP